MWLVQDDVQDEPVQQSNSAHLQFLMAAIDFTIEDNLHINFPALFGHMRHHAGLIYLAAYTSMKVTGTDAPTFVKLHEAGVMAILPPEHVMKLLAAKNVKDEPESLMACVNANTLGRASWGEHIREVAATVIDEQVSKIVEEFGVTTDLNEAGIDACL